jgi:hypothetical protein
LSKIITAISVYIEFSTENRSLLPAIPAQTGISLFLLNIWQGQITAYAGISGGDWIACGVGIAVGGMASRVNGYPCSLFISPR